jgi:hypothetical protein
MALRSVATMVASRLEMKAKLDGFRWMNATRVRRAFTPGPYLNIPAINITKSLLLASAGDLGIRLQPFPFLNVLNGKNRFYFRFV